MIVSDILINKAFRFVFPFPLASRHFTKEWEATPVITRFMKFELNDFQVVPRARLESQTHFCDPNAFHLYAR